METRAHTRKVSSSRKKTLKHKLPFLKHYQGISGYDASIKNLKEHRTTYGEVDDKSLPVINELFNKYAPINNIESSFRNFYDLGSGVGKLVIAMASMNPTLQSTGIEIVPDRLKNANIALEKINDTSISNRIEFLCISMLDDSINYLNACWIYISNLCLTIKVNNAIFDKLANELKKGCIIICLCQTNNSFFKELDYINLPMSWDVKTKVYIYTKI